MVDGEVLVDDGRAGSRRTRADIAAEARAAARELGGARRCIMFSSRSAEC